MMEDALFVVAGLIAMAAEVLALTLITLGVCLNWAAFKRLWWHGLLIAVGLVCVLVPVAAFNLYYFDPAAVEPNADDTTLAVAWGVQVAVSVGGPIWMALCIIAGYPGARAEWARVAGRFAWVHGGHWRAGWMIGAGLGVLIGLVSILVFVLADVGLGSMLEEQMLMFPGSESAPFAVVLLVSLGFAGAAVYEEIIYRGVILGMLTRWCGGQVAVIWLANLGVALLFAALHLLNTDAPAIKFGQILVLAGVLAWLMNRFGLGAAIACHLAMNLTITPLELAFMHD